MNVHNYNHLFYFYVTAKLSGMTTAAKYLRTSQSSLSTQIKNLESVIGKNLFHRVGRKIELTEAGRELYGYCRRGFEVFDEMFDHLNQGSSARGVRITIGVSPDVERPLLTDALADISNSMNLDRRPLLNLVSLPTVDLLHQLKLGDIDLLVVAKSVTDPELEVHSSFDFPVGVYCAPDIAKKVKTKNLDDILKAPETAFVLPSRLTNLRAEANLYFAKRKLRPPCVFESNILATVIRAATDGMGVTVMPDCYVAQELKQKRLVALHSKPLWRHRISILCLPQRLEGAKRIVADGLASHLREVL